MEQKKPYSKISEMLRMDQPKDIKITADGVVVSSVGKLNQKKFVQMAVRL